MPRVIAQAALLFATLVLPSLGQAVPVYDISKNILLGDDAIEAGVEIRVDTSKVVRARYSSIDQGDGIEEFVQIDQIVSANDRSAVEQRELSWLAEGIGLFLGKKDIDRLEQDSRGNYRAIRTIEIFRMDEFAWSEALMKKSLGKADQLSRYQPSPSSNFQDEWVKFGVPRQALDQALAYMNGFPLLRRKDYLVIADYSKLSNTKRLFIINLLDGVIEKFYLAHGSGRKGEVPALKTTKFSNEIDSLLTPKGFHVTGFRYRSTNAKHKAWGGYGMRLLGQEPVFNGNTMERGVVMHGTKFATDAYVQKMGVTGRSNGCPATDRKQAQRLIAQLEGGVLWYHYAGD